MADLSSKPRHLPAQRAGQPADLTPTAPAPAEPAARQVDQPAEAGQRLRWPWLLADCGILTVSSLVAGLGILGLTVMWLIANRLHGADRANLQIDAIKYGLGFIAAGGAAAALLLGVRRQQLAERSHDLELRKQTHVETDAAERRVTELFTKAVEQLGSGDAAVRLGGLYALERVAQNNPDQRQTVVDVICAYLRMPYNPPATASPANKPEDEGVGPSTSGSSAAVSRDPRQEIQVRFTAQRVLTKHLHRPDNVDPADLNALATDRSQQFWPRIDLDLTGATLVDWALDNCEVRRATFGGATFTGNAGFVGATFGGNAGFVAATFTGNAQFGGATFTGVAQFVGAIFTGNAWFVGATFGGYAGFDEATFTGDAQFGRATFTGNARFDGVNFAASAGFDEATFTWNARFDGATFTGNAQFDGANLHRRRRVRRGDLYWRRPARRGDLQEQRRSLQARHLPHHQSGTPTGSLAGRLVRQARKRVRRAAIQGRRQAAGHWSRWRARIRPMIPTSPPRPG